MIFPIAKNKMASLFAFVGLWENRKMNYIFDLNFSFLHQIFWFIRIGENFVRNSMRNFSYYLWHFQLQKNRFFFHKIIFQNFLSLKAEIIIKQKKKKFGWMVVWEATYLFVTGFTHTRYTQNYVWTIQRAQINWHAASPPRA